MLMFLKEWITAVVSMVIFMTVIDLVLPHNSGFKKYVSLVTGLIVVITILVPVFKLIDKRVDVQATILQYTDDFNKKQYEIDKSNLQKSINEQTMEVYKEKLRKQIEQEVYRETGKKYTVIKLEVVEDTNSINYAEIKALEFKVSQDESSVKPVDKVVIGGQQTEEKEFKDVKVINFLKEKFNIDPSLVKFKK